MNLSSSEPYFKQERDRLAIRSTANDDGNDFGDGGSDSDDIEGDDYYSSMGEGSNSQRARNGAAPSTASTSALSQHTSQVNITNVGHRVWLVKVPKYIETRWNRIPGDVEAAKMRIIKDPRNPRSKVTLSLSEAAMCLRQPDEADVPKDHELVFQSLAAQSLGVFSTEEEQVEVPAVPDEDDEEPVGDKTETLILEKVAVAGLVDQRLDCRPVADNNYLKLKLAEIKKTQQPTRQVIQLEHVVNTYKPVSDHKHNIEFEERRKAEGKKSRDDKDKVLEMLFSAFESHQYYNLKDLVTMTNQPVGYLKELLKEVCNYCMKNPHKNMWELKPEYRHYKSDTPAPAGGNDGSSDSDDDDHMDVD